MTYQNKGDTLTMVGETLEKYRFVALGTTEERLAQEPVLDGEIIGATENAVDTKGSISVALRGIVEITAAAAITIGAKISTDADGKAILYTTGVVVGVAMTACAAGDERISVLLK